jgi:DNA-binding NarL/FixJ family response regulator
MNVRILIVDDHQIIRDGLRALLEGQAGYQVVGEASDGRAALSLADENAADVCIMDVTMPGLNGVDATAQMARQHPELKIIGLSMHSDPHTVSRMLDAGAAGYVPKDSAFEEITEAVKSVMQNNYYLGAGLASEVVRHNQSPNALPAGNPRLTPREREVLQLIAEGSKTTRIAETLGVSVKTVESHRKNIMRKLDLHTVAQLTKYALREGLTTLVD